MVSGSSGPGNVSASANHVAAGLTLHTCQECQRVFDSERGLSQHTHFPVAPEWLLRTDRICDTGPLKWPITKCPHWHLSQWSQWIGPSHQCWPSCHLVSKPPDYLGQWSQWIGPSHQCWPSCHLVSKPPDYLGRWSQWVGPTNRYRSLCCSVTKYPGTVSWYLSRWNHCCNLNGCHCVTTELSPQITWYYLEEKTRCYWE